MLASSQDPTKWPAQHITYNTSLPVSRTSRLVELTWSLGSSSSRIGKFASPAPNIVEEICDDEVEGFDNATHMQSVEANSGQFLQEAGYPLSGLQHAENRHSWLVAPDQRPWLARFLHMQGNAKYFGQNTYMGVHEPGYHAQRRQSRCP